MRKLCVKLSKLKPAHSAHRPTPTPRLVCHGFTMCAPSARFSPSFSGNSQPTTGKHKANTACVPKHSHMFTHLDKKHKWNSRFFIAPPHQHRPVERVRSRMQMRANLRRPSKTKTIRVFCLPDIPLRSSDRSSNAFFCCVLELTQPNLENEHFILMPPRGGDCMDGQCYQKPHFVLFPEFSFSFNNGLFFIRIFSLNSCFFFCFRLDFNSRAVDGLILAQLWKVVAMGLLNPFFFVLAPICWPWASPGSTLNILSYGLYFTRFFF